MSDKTYKGKITKLKLDQEFEKSNGEGTFEGHLLKIEDDDGDAKSFKISAKSPASKYLHKLKVGDKVDVKVGGKFKSVTAVFSGDGKGGYAKSQKGAYDPTGAIQGMVLKSAIDIALKEKPADATLVETIVSAAKDVLKAKKKVDELVAKALKKRSDTEDSDEEDDDEGDSEDNETDSDDEEEEKPKKKSRKKSEEDEESDEDSPY